MDRMIYYTSDLYFGHRNAIDFDNRPYADVEEMDARLIENWNARVSDENEGAGIKCRLYD